MFRRIKKKLINLCNHIVIIGLILHGCWNPLFMHEHNRNTGFCTKGSHFTVILQGRNIVYYYRSRIQSSTGN